MRRLRIEAAKRQWSTVTRPWNSMSLSLADEARQRMRVVEHTVPITVQLPLQHISRMASRGLITRAQAAIKDEQAISGVMLESLQDKLYGKVRATRL